MVLDDIIIWAQLPETEEYFNDGVIAGNDNQRVNNIHVTNQQQCEQHTG